MTTRLAVVGAVVLASTASVVREHWRRLLVGALVGWALASIVGAFAVVALELRFGYSASQVEAAVFVWVGIAAGAVTAYAVRRGHAEP